MERLTSNKKVSDMSMFELAHNSCYYKDGVARYRDFENDIDARELTRHLLKDYADGDDAFVDEDDFDEEMLELLMYGTSTTEGLIALFYRNMWAMADLRERLKEYEDLEEQGRLIKLPCNVGDTLYSALGEKVLKSEVISVKYHCEAENHGVFIRERIIIDTDDFETEINFSDIGKTVFLTKSEAEAKLKELRDGENE